jgi:CubicO group peptidase (beta-lactamase class C family)
LLSTADDYLTFARMLMGGGKVNGVRVLKESSVKLMTSNHITPEQRKIPSPGIINWLSQGFGYGVMIVENPLAYESAGQGMASAGTYGWGGAFGGWWQNDPKEEIALIWLQECLPPPPRPGAFASGPPRVPGAVGLTGFVKAAYAALCA